MSKLTPQEIEELTRQLKEKTLEIKQIYDKLVEAGAAPLPEDLLDSVAGGTVKIPHPYFTAQPIMSIHGSVYRSDTN